MKVCFVGVGSIGKRHIKNIKTVKKDVEIHILRNTTKQIDEEISAMLSKIAHSKEELDAWYDAIFITNPTFLHYNTLVDLYNLSDYFFMEKPVFDSVEYDLSVFDKKKKVYVACPLRYTKVINRAKSILENEEVISVRAICSSYLPNWRKNTDYRKVYSAHKSEGGGVCIDLIHEWDYLTYLFGFPDRVFSLCGKYSNLEIDSEDLAIYIAQYKDKLLELHLDYIGKQSKRLLEVITNDSNWEFDILNGTITRDSLIMESFDETPNDKYIEEMKYFLDYVMSDYNSNDIGNSINVLKLSMGMEKKYD